VVFVWCHFVLLFCSEALAATQRQLEEASSRAREAEEQQLLAAAEAARLQQQVGRAVAALAKHNA
jgi:hypothetical protein